MNKFIKYFFILLGFLFLIGMVGSIIHSYLFFHDDFNVDNEYKKGYVNACVDRDFEKARAEALKLESASSDKAEEGLKYVNDKEIYYLLAKPSLDNDARILYLYNTYEESQLPDMEDVLNVAISMGNENLAEKLIKSGVGISLGTILSAVNAEMDQIVDLIISKDPDLILNQEVGNFYRECGSSDRYSEVLQACLNKNIDLPVRGAIGVINTYSNTPGYEEYEVYRTKVTDANNRYIKIITAAVYISRWDIANKALSRMKPNIEWINLGGCKWRISENKLEINEARKIIQSSKH